MSKWFSIDSNHRNHPKQAFAGFWATTVITAAWEIAKEYDCADGDITGFWQARYIAMWLKVPAELAENIEPGMQSCIDVGLIDLRDDRVFIHDWDEQQRHTPAMKQRAYRQRKKETYIIDSVTTRCNAKVTRCNDGNDEVTPLQRVDTSIPNHNHNHNHNHNKNTQSRARAIPSSTDTVLEVTHDDYALADTNRLEVITADPEHRLASDITWDQQRPEHATAFARLRREGKSPADIREMIAWGHADAHWSAVLQVGPEKFSQHWSTMKAQRKRAGRSRDGGRGPEKCTVTPEELAEFESRADKLLEKYPDLQGGS